MDVVTGSVGHHRRKMKRVVETKESVYPGSSLQQSCPPDAMFVWKGMKGLTISDELDDITGHE